MNLTLFFSIFFTFTSGNDREILSPYFSYSLPKHPNFYSALSKSDIKRMCGRYRHQQGISPYCRKVEQMNRKMATNLFW